MGDCLSDLIKLYFFGYSDNVREGYNREELREKVDDWMKNVAVFNDLSGFGKCSLTAAIPVLSVLGVTCHPVPTAVLTGQGGYPVFYYQDLTKLLPKYTKAWKKNEAKLDGIYSGYLTGPEQLECFQEFCATFRHENTFLLVDPVMGDNGRVYRIFSPELLEKMKEITAKANLITPNLTEACLLADMDFKEVTSIKEPSLLLEKVKEIGKKLEERAKGNQEIIITGVKTKEGNDTFIYNVLVSKEEFFHTRCHFFEKSFSGTGDLFASTMCGLKMQGVSTKKAMKIAGEFLYRSIADTMNENTSGNDGILFEKNLFYLMKEGLQA